MIFLEDFTVQKGTIRRVGKCWLLRYYEPILQDGRVIKRAKAVKLATYSDEYRTEQNVRPLADLILAPINAKTMTPESRQTVANFIEHVYLPYCKESLKPSTVNGYGKTFKKLKPYLGDLELRKVRTSDIDRIIKAVATPKPLAHTTIRNIKTFLSGAFRYAKRTDLIAENPVRDSVTPRGKPAGDTHAYTLHEILKMVEVLPEPSKTAVVTAAFTGLRKSELMALRWEDINGDQLNIVRSVWSGHVTDTKTLSSRAPVPLVPIVKRVLEEHRKRTPDGFIFQGGTGKPLRLENVLRRDMLPALERAKIEWHGWHAFRRGIGTNLNLLGAPMKTIQAILRHGDIATTEAFYVKPVAAESVKVMRKLERAFNKLK
jgi:integrase